MLAAKFQEETFQDCFLVDLYLHQGNKLEVFIDCDSGMTVEKCQRISRYLEHHIDEEGLLGEHYGIEVSSPGLGRSLKLVRQYQKNIGRTFEFTLIEGDPITGVLKAATDKVITVEFTVETKEGKKKKKETVQTEIPFENIKKAMVVISF